MRETEVCCSCMLFIYRHHGPGHLCLVKTCPGHEMPQMSSIVFRQDSASNSGSWPCGVGSRDVSSSSRRRQAEDCSWQPSLPPPLPPNLLPQLPQRQAQDTGAQAWPLIFPSPRHMAATGRRQAFLLFLPISQARAHACLPSFLLPVLLLFSHARGR